MKMGAGGLARTGEPSDPGGRRAQAPPEVPPLRLRVSTPGLPQEGHAAIVEDRCVPVSRTPQPAVEREDLAGAAPVTAPAAGKEQGERQVHGGEVPTKTLKVLVCSVANRTGSAPPRTGIDPPPRKFAAGVTSLEDLGDERPGVQGCPVPDAAAGTSRHPRQVMDSMDGNIDGNMDGKLPPPPGPHGHYHKPRGAPCSTGGVGGMSGGTPPVDCAAYDFIRQVEGSQGGSPPVQVESQGAGEVAEASGWGSLVGEVPHSAVTPGGGPCSQAKGGGSGGSG